MSIEILKTASLGFPRIGAKRELKFALEAYWNGKSSEKELLVVAANIRKQNWLLQQKKGIDIIPSNDFSLYDHVLDLALMVGAIPADYQWQGGQVPLEIYFAMARGSDGESGCNCYHHDKTKKGIAALEMTKWFDTNYHYMVPELTKNQKFRLTSTKAIDEFLEAKALGIITRPVLLGPVSFLMLCKTRSDDFDRLALLPALLPVYQKLLQQLATLGCPWVQVDEPFLVTDLTVNQRAAYDYAYKAIRGGDDTPKIMLTSYFGGLGDNLKTALALPVEGLHIDLVRAPHQLGDVLAGLKGKKQLSLGVLDGRNIWRSNLAQLIELITPVVTAIGSERVEIAPSCSLLHVPVTLENEQQLDDDLKNWLSFASEKLDELHILGRYFSHGEQSVVEELALSQAAARSRSTSDKIHNHAVKNRLQQAKTWPLARKSAFKERHNQQKALLNLPLLPTTTIGSFPQDSDVRQARAALNKGAWDKAHYDAFITQKTKECVLWQEEIGLDVLVHGEFERNDMVQYFGEQLNGFAFTSYGWVQSYGSRCVRPPIIFGDVFRPQPMTVTWWQKAQSFTQKPLKAMLTGPVTILNWSFVRDDMTREMVCHQIALAIRDEVHDLEQAGAKIIQIDEAALREGLPLRAKDWQHYLDWAVNGFRLCVSSVADHTQIHTHMCYSEFNDIIVAIAAMDADVISIETSRSKMELLAAFRNFAYPNDIGPGVYDIHSPRIPAVEDMVTLLKMAFENLALEQLWVNPDCGLKTRQWQEVKPSLIHMVEAAKQLRETL